MQGRCTKNDSHFHTRVAKQSLSHTSCATSTVMLDTCWTLQYLHGRVQHPMLTLLPRPLLADLFLLISSCNCTGSGSPTGGAVAPCPPQVPRLRCLLLSAACSEQLQRACGLQ
eukprot:jgi/Ulvmu1/10343/UM061_0026.1